MSSLRRTRYNEKPAWQWGKYGRPFVYEEGDEDAQNRAKRLAIKDGKKQERRKREAVGHND